jgi:HPt (histidine-containing phosphotransfer) domain-containing protein
MREAGAEAVVDHILDLFIKNAPRHLAALTEAVGSANGPAIERAAHAFKSPTGSIGARRLEQILLALELAGKAGAIEQAHAMFIQMGPETESVLRYLHLERTKEQIHD